MKLNADVDEVLLTAAGYAELQRELERLQTVRLPEATVRLRQALEFAGDRGEDLEFRDATREREELEERIARLEARLATARVLEPSVAGPSARAALGLRVELQDLDTGQQSSFQLVGSAEANPGEGRLSIESPVGRALIGHASGEVVEAATPHGTRNLRIVGVGAEN